MLGKRKVWMGVLLCVAALLAFVGCGKKAPMDGCLELVNSPSTTLDNVWYNPGGIFRCAVFESLLIADADMKEIKGALAEEYSISEDGKTYVLRLRDDVKWHDGEAFDGEDVVFSIKMALRSEEVNGLFTSTVKYIVGAGAYAVGETEELAGITLSGNELTIRLNEPMGDFLNVLAQFAILPEHILGDVEPLDLPKSDFWKKPVGCGIYKVIEAVEGEYFLLEANMDYYGDLAGIKQLKISLNKEDCVKAMTDGELDFYVTNDPAEISRLKGIERCNEHRLNILFPAYLIFNFSENGNMSKELKDVRVRRALLLAIDRESITTSVFPGSTVSNTLIPEWDSWYYSDGEDFKFNQEAAKKLLEEANFDFSKTLRLRYSKKGQSTVDLMNAIAVYWREIGIKVDLADFEGSGSEHMFEIRDFDVCYKRLSAFDHASIYEEVDGGGIMQQKLLNMPVYDELLNELSNTTSDGHRKELILKLQQLDQEYLLRIPLFFLANTAYVNYKCFKMPDVYGNLWYRYDLQFSDWSLKR